MIPGAGDSFSQIDYSTVDKYPLPGTSFYRLIQTDFDGNQSLSAVKSAFYKKDNTQIEIFPNPTNNELNILMPSDENTNVLIFNNLGQLVFEKEFFSQQKIQLNFETNDTGLFLLKIEQSRQLFSKKIILKK